MTTALLPIPIVGPTPAASLDRLLPDLARALGEISRQLEQPRPLGWFRDEILWDYRGHSKTARLKMAQAFREFLAIAGPEAMTSHLSPSLVAKFAARAGRASTTNGLLSSLHAAFTIGVDRHYCAESRVTSCCWRVPKDAPRRKHLERAQIQTALGHLQSLATDWDGWRLYALGMTYAYTGVRRNEALMLRVTDVDLERGFIFVSPNGRPLKTPGSEAPVPICARLRPVLIRQIELCDSEWLFPKNARTGPWLHGKAGQRPGDRLRSEGESVGVLNFTSQTLRHSLASHLVGYHGLTTKQTQLLLRHADEQTTVRNYVHPDLVNLAESLRDFDYAGRADVAAEKPRARVSTGRPWKRRPTRGSWSMI